MSVARGNRLDREWISEVVDHHLLEDILAVPADGAPGMEAPGGGLAF